MKFINNLPIKNITAKPGRSGSLLIFAILLAVVTFGGAVIVSSLRNGMKNLEKRLGADIIVVPYQTRTKMSIDDILLRGNRSKAYMDKSIIKKLYDEVEGIEVISPQLYVSSLSASCCSTKVEIIGYDPQTDFTIQPWIQESYTGEITDSDILIGCKVDMPLSGKLRFFGIDFNVAAQLHQTGSGLDDAVYVNMNSIKTLAAACSIKSPTSKIDANKQVSTLMIKVKDGYSVEDVKNEINIHNKKVRAVQSRTLTTSVSDDINGMSRIIGILIVCVWILCLTILCIVFSMVINERKKEFAILRVAGLSQKKLSSLITTESVILNTAGGLFGIVISLLILLPFNALIEQSMTLPYIMPNFAFVATIALVTLAISALTGAISSSYKAKQISKQDTSLILREN